MVTQHVPLLNRLISNTIRADHRCGCAIRSLLPIGTCSVFLVPGRNSPSYQDASHESRSRARIGVDDRRPARTWLLWQYHCLSHALDRAKPLRASRHFPAVTAPANMCFHPSLDGKRHKKPGASARGRRDMRAKRRSDMGGYRDEQRHLQLGLSRLVLAAYMPCWSLRDNGPHLQ